MQLKLAGARVAWRVLHGRCDVIGTEGRERGGQLCGAGSEADVRGCENGVFSVNVVADTDQASRQGNVDLLVFCRKFPYLVQRTLDGWRDVVCEKKEQVKCISFN